MMHICSPAEMVSSYFSIAPYSKYFSEHVNEHLFYLLKIFKCLFFYFGVYVNVYMFVCLYVYVCLCVCMCLCVHVYVCVSGWVGNGKGLKRVLESVLQVVAGQKIWMLGTPVLLKGQQML